MARSPALGLYLLWHRGGSAARRDAPARPEGRVVWLHLGEGVLPAVAARLAARLRAERNPPQVLVTGETADAIAAAPWPAGCIADRAPAEREADIAAFLDHWRPAQVTLVQAAPRPGIVTALTRRGIPAILYAQPPTRGSTLSWRLRPSMARTLFTGFRRILATDTASAERLLALSGGETPIEVAGPLRETADPVPHVESERVALAGIIRTRPVWFACGCPEAEEEAVIAAHRSALRLSHRCLLILQPLDPARGPALAERLAAEDWTVALRSRDEDPDEDVAVLLADGEGETGLWYRLAPITFLGGTLLGSGPSRNPFEPAVLGSAIISGPQTAPFPETFRRLSESRALRLVRTSSALADAVGELVAPDRAAILAHNGWVCATDGAEVIERIAAAIQSSLAADAAGPAAA
ncbi:MAG: 3-deoxy-D-manno-octulosonic acid transferase [Rhodobacteraceae bacterium]|nr:3-deoxy-D-manno-octulosonic acid transferase [Paracoccaceae bacterium]